jgi:hypothetical protein
VGLSEPLQSCTVTYSSISLEQMTLYFPHGLIHSINWECCQAAIKQLGLTWSLWVPKWLSGFTPEFGKVIVTVQPLPGPCQMPAVCHLQNHMLSTQGTATMGCVDHTTDPLGHYYSDITRFENNHSHWPMFMANTYTDSNSIICLAQRQCHHTPSEPYRLASLHRRRRPSGPAG